MDEYVVEKAGGGHGFSSKGSGIVFRDEKHEDRSIRDCNRLGCSSSSSSSRLNSMKGTQIGDLEKAKYVKATTFGSSSSKTIAGSSSKSLSSYGGCRKSSFHERRKRTLQREKVIAESSNSQGNIGDSEFNDTQHFIEELDIKSREIEDSECSKSIPTKVGIQTLLPDSEELELPILEQVSTNTSNSAGSCTIASSSKSHDQINHNFGSGNRTVSSRFFFRLSTDASKNSGNAASPASQGLGIEAHRCGLKSLICTPVSDVIPSGHSSSDLSCNRQIDAVRKRPSGGENSAAKGEGTRGPSTGRYSGSMRKGISGLSRSLPEHLIRRQTLLNIRNRPTSGNTAVSVRTHQTSTGDARTTLSEQGVGNILPVHEPVVIAPPQQNQVSISEADPESSSRSSSTELPNVSLNSSEHPGSSSRTAQDRMVSHPEDRSTNILQGSSGDRDGYRRFNMDRIDEVFSHFWNSHTLSYTLVVHGYLMESIFFFFPPQNSARILSEIIHG
ncbi:E3 ubiquitin-protein ligase RLIM-like [Cocos nucifera]|uniref:E3 ubiquitin-protein ligase RLIM-like n=1 Tax=Cocos nucifera TaxID=13894 RepID=A0A8K0IQG3_COCNU|nr:E3 ubiquitin-protein ligase RLIM-like [Cocos nucifera]